MSVRDFFKRLFCKHEYVWDRNIYGDEVERTGGMRSWWRCTKCGKKKAMPELNLAGEFTCCRHRKKTATDDLRAMLNEHGIEWWGDSDFDTDCTEWVSNNGPVFTALSMEDHRLAIQIICMMTPEEVVDQTLSGGKCNRIFDEDYIVGINGYCESYRCSECGQPLFKSFNYCPWCGKEIVE